MEIKEEISHKKCNYPSRKRKSSLTLVQNDAKLQCIDRVNNSKIHCDKVNITLKRRVTICPSVDNFDQAISWDIFKLENNESLCRFHNPLPFFDWSDSFETWKSMILKDTESIYKRSTMLFMKHPCLQPRMRAILLDWLNEVCDVYKMQRKSFYLAIDFIDRYLSRIDGIQKKSLQLIGVTALFIASKAEEIYPPKLSDFSFITDGACSSTDILKQELDMIQVLKWKISPVSPVCWVACFLQVIYCKSSTDFLITQFEQNLFVRVCRLLDLCILNPESIKFSYYILAVSAVSFYIRNKSMLLKVTATSQEQLGECREWMQPYHNVLMDKAIACASFQDIVQQSAHNIQTHVTSLDLLDTVQEKSFSQQSLNKDNKGSLRSEICGSATDAIQGVLTPPRSTDIKLKSIHLVNQNN